MDEKIVIIKEKAYLDDGYFLKTKCSKHLKHIKFHSYQKNEYMVQIKTQVDRKIVLGPDSSHFLS